MPSLPAPTQPDFEKKKGNRLRASLIVPILTAILSSPVPIHAQGTNSASSSTVIKLPRVMVTGERRSYHDVESETERVGPALQPEWTTRRAFAETDIYVIPPGEIEYNQFYISSHPRSGRPGNSFESEFEFGLPWRTQFDVELNYRVERGKWGYDSTRLEMPHALAPWGELFLNPALDAGWRFRNGQADSFLFRLLLAEEFAGRWHFGANFGYEHQVGGERETELELTTALSYVTIDKRLTIGAELLAEHEFAEEGESVTEVLLGPLLLYRPTDNLHTGLVLLAGLTHDAPAFEAFVIFGIDLELFRKGFHKSSTRDLPMIRSPR